MVATTPQEEKADTLGKTMGDVKAKPIVDTLHDKLRQAKNKINFDTIGNLSAQVLVDKMAKRLQKAKAWTRLLTLDYLKILIYTLVDILGKHLAETLADTSRNVETETLVETVADTIRKAKAGRRWALDS